MPGSDITSTRAWSARHDIVVAAAICVGAWVLLALTAADVGLTYDEPVYMGRADLAAKWLGLLVTNPAAAFSRPIIEELWPPKDMQPPLVKLTAAVTGPICLNLHLLPEWAAPLVWLRTGTMFWVGVALAVMYLLLRAAGLGRAAAGFGPLTLLFLPRVFGHAHLLALDAPAMATCFIAGAAGWWAVERQNRLSLLAASAAFGLAVATKLNGFFVPLAVLPYALVVRPRRAGLLAVGYAVFGPLMLIGFWPWMWFDTAEHLRQYLAFHWHHWKIGVLYFGRVWTQAPWHYPLVMTAITTPLVPLVMAIAGLGRWMELVGRALPLAAPGENFSPDSDEDSEGRGPQTASREPHPGRRRDEPMRRRGPLSWAAAERLWLLAGLGLAVNLAPNMLPSAPKYGGVRLFLPAFAWLAVLAALVFHRLVVRLRAAVSVGPDRAWLVGAVLLAAGLAPSLGHIAHFHPYELSYYNALIGGLPGAAARGFEPTYWGEAYLAAAGWLNRNAPEGAAVWIDPPGVESIMRMYKFLGRLRPDIVTLAGEETVDDARFVVSQNKPTEFSELVKRLLREQQPAWTDGVDGVPLVFVWRVDGGADGANVGQPGPVSE